MRTPLCEFCLQTSDLCGGCGHKLETGAISQLEVDLSRILKKFEEKLALEKVVFTRAVDCGNIVFLFTSTSPGYLIGRGGKTVSTIIKELGKHVRVVAENSDLHKLAEEILLPVKPLGINAVFHEGREVTKIVLSKREAAKLPTRASSLEKLFEKLLQKPVTVSLE